MTSIRFILMRSSFDVIATWQQPGQWDCAEQFATEVLRSCREASFINVSKEDCSEVFELFVDSNRSRGYRGDWMGRVTVPPTPMAE